MFVSFATTCKKPSGHREHGQKFALPIAIDEKNLVSALTKILAATF